MRERRINTSTRDNLLCLCALLFLKTAVSLFLDFVPDAAAAGAVAPLRLLEPRQDQIQLGRQLLDQADVLTG